MKRTNAVERWGLAIGLAAMLACLFVLAGCKREAEEETTVAKPTAAEPALPAAKLGTATLEGTVAFRGTLPPSASPNKSFPECSRQAKKPAGDPSVIKGENGGLKNAFVWVKEGLTPGSYPSPTEPVLVDQKQCEFEPRVVGAQVGQPVVFVNSDAFLHNVKTAQFNVAMPTAGMRVTRKFDQPEVMVPLTCEVHAWMRSFVGVVAHPFFAVTDEKGAFQIKNLPAGQYTVEVWHERLGRTTKPVAVTDGQSARLDVELTAPSP